MTSELKKSHFWLDDTYLTEKAERCARLARLCPDRTTALELEALAADLMAKAAEVRELLQLAQSEPVSPPVRGSGGSI